LWY
ncbi:hypothetical protein ACTFIW_008864, partial [Dictyostelium discoideum]|jgi:FtsP/CotA-like multicopper oxidase with cupredoxin domain